MKLVPLLAAMLVMAAVLDARQADAATAEQTLNISFTGVYQGPTNTTAAGIATTAPKTVAITSAQVVRAIAFDLKDTHFTVWNGASLRVSTDFVTGDKTFILRKGVNSTNVSRFFTGGQLDFDNQINDLKVARNPSTHLLYFSSITYSGLQTLQVSTSNLSFTLTGFGNSQVITATKSRTTNSILVSLVRVPSAQPDPAPAAFGSFAYNLFAATPTTPATFVSGPVSRAAFSLGNPDTTH